MNRLYISSTSFLPGTVIKVHRGFYYHFGVYVGGGRVVHFTATGKNELNPATADVQETAFTIFSKGDPVSVDTGEIPTFESDEIVRRARSMVGTKLGTYNLITNNCEHFANWCRCDKLISHQQILVDKISDVLLKSSPFLKGLKDVILQYSQTSKRSLYAGKQTKQVRAYYSKTRIGSRKS